MKLCKKKCACSFILFVSIIYECLRFETTECDAFGIVSILVFVNSN